MWAQRKVTIADRIWNRAALEQGGVSPRSGDYALASLLLLHGLVMNGGVHHALESVDAAELTAAADGYAFFGFHDVAAFLRTATSDPLLSEWTQETEVIANARYENMIPSDSDLVARFEEVFRNQATDFAPLDDW